MLRIYFLQQWFNLSHPLAEDAIHDCESMRRFARVELGDDVVPDETTFCSTLETPTVDIFAMELLVAAKLECWHVAGFNQAINGAPMYLQIHRGQVVYGQNGGSTPVLSWRPWLRCCRGFFQLQAR